jgi:membrane associated rhomboid family serine protease
MLPIQNAVPFRYPPVATWGLIAANCTVFLFELSLGPRELELLLSSFALIPAQYSQAAAYGGEAATTLNDYLPFGTYMFLHGGWLHLILNMWTLWLFGPPIEDRLGHMRYLLFYFACGVAAAVTHVVFNAASTAPVLGASGAIAGVLGCYTRLFPFARLVVVIPILFFPFFFEVPAFIFTVLWFLMQMIQGTGELLMPSAGGGIAWWAHVGGFVAGLLLAPVIRQSTRRYRLYYPDEGILGFDPSGRR